MSAPFSKQEVFTELATIFLFEGDHLALGGGLKFAEAFLGFSPDDGENYCYDAPQKVDLSRFPIAGSFDRGYDYAFAPTNPMQIGEHEVQDLIAFMEGTPRIGGTSGAGEQHPFMTPQGRCRHVADMVSARWRLEVEWDDYFSIRDLALLANMREGAVRNAMSVKELKAQKRGSRTVVERADALAWLLGRKGFVPTPAAPDRRETAVRQLLSARNPGEFGKALAAALAEIDLSDRDIEESIGWSASDRKRWLQGGVADVFAEATRLARVLGLDETELIGCLRRLAHNQST